MEQQAQDELEQQLAYALDQVEQGYITQEYMAIIRYACNMPKPKQNLVFDFNEII
jgi:hypothetical protein